MALFPQQHKSAFIMRLLNNPFHPKNKEIVQQNYGIQLPHLHKRPGASVSCWKILFYFFLLLFCHHILTLMLFHPNLYDFIFSAEHKENILKIFGYQTIVCDISQNIFC